MTHAADGVESVRPPPPEEHGGEALVIHPVIEQLTRCLAIVGGLLLLAAVAITLISVVGRYVFNEPLPGDYETVEMVAAVGIFLFLPYAHATNSNIVVRFFTDQMPQRGKRVLDFGHDIIFTLVAALIAWRLTIGFIDKFHTGESTMLVRIPYWWSFGFAVASMILLCVVCIARLHAGAKALRQ